ncbi:MAG: hypothetical protein KAT05_13800 [Spirochaetes bacterium]|nr:hypothetical protein [Spirochaetota bacterium]
MLNVKFCILLVIGIFLVSSTPVLGESCEINTMSPDFIPYGGGFFSFFVMPEDLSEYLSTEVNYKIKLYIQSINCNNINNTVNITVSVCKDYKCNDTFYNRTLKNSGYYSFPNNSFPNKLREMPISFSEEGNYTINFQFFNKKNESIYNHTIQKKVSLLENNIILYSSISSIIFSSVNLILTIAIILLSAFYLIEILQKIYNKIFKEIEERNYDVALKNILKPLFYLYSLYLVTSFIIDYLFSNATLFTTVLMWISNNIELLIIISAFHSLIFARKKLRNYNYISLLFALYFLGTHIYGVKYIITNDNIDEILLMGGFLVIIPIFCEILLGIILWVAYVISFLAIVLKMLYDIKPKIESLIKLNFRNKIEEFKKLIGFLPDFISFYLVYVIIKNVYWLLIYYEKWIGSVIVLFIANILITKIMEIETFSIKSLLNYIISLLLLFLSLVAINESKFVYEIMGSYNRGNYIYTMISYDYWLQGTIILITVAWFFYIFKKYRLIKQIENVKSKIQKKYR